MNVFCSPLELSGSTTGSWTVMRGLGLRTLHFAWLHKPITCHFALIGSSYTSLASCAVQEKKKACVLHASSAVLKLVLSRCEWGLSSLLFFLGCFSARLQPAEAFNCWNRHVSLLTLQPKSLAIFTLMNNSNFMFLLHCPKFRIANLC